MNIDENILKGITGITYDSRKVSKGNIFVCIKGEKSDGHNFAAQAAEKGAALIVSEKELNGNISCPHIVVKDTRLALAQLSAKFYDYPAQKLGLIGVTGTNGKTTVTHLIESIFEKAGTSCALIGTLGSRFSSLDDYASTDHTTPQASDLQQNLRVIVDKGIKRAVMEVSSHSLCQDRVAGCEFKGAVFTNLTQDHLDYHITMDNYFKAKAQLLELMQEDSYAITNADDEYFKGLKHTLSYGINNDADIKAENIKFSVNGSEFLCKTPSGSKQVKLQLTGQFNIYNVLTAIAVGIAEGIPFDTCIEAVEAIPGIPGRFEVVSREPLVIVDYAHTPNGLENILNAAKELVPDNGKLVCVFGCGGDRDVTKRPQMGRIAEDICDKVIITSDNPRTEDSQQIITDILTGIQELDSKKITVEVDRTIAIEQAIFNARPQDVIVLAGKGHETYQIVGTEKHHFDDREEAAKALQKVMK
ncbi:MAG: UDP-N-acetylmuramoyl-L-alanyl-D-glutamate--2,6-diaminopimelate ligase [Candidatus Melainabacteria bacterium GWF2_37_15]|nr:MAG: UDP-N-acetylmuramoyl-L-alanyl-D-glutamate--2,6-diaminopimelate ligase [Candidatus Melainabacteria bacterium GWF2_37_15]